MSKVAESSKPKQLLTVLKLGPLIELKHNTPVSKKRTKNEQNTKRKRSSLQHQEATGTTNYYADRLTSLRVSEQPKRQPPTANTFSMTTGRLRVGQSGMTSAREGRRMDIDERRDLCS